ncbi:coiled-coil domain-containing protein [Stutzerimonas balearica]|uniref:hypothetical protein n=1 Tax=Stutzerimonas balearica TaxID=74829 RepID=UPI00190DC15D|nr:hypothetical protein [Stutzerimonas balearica]MBK3749287.1 hypothetical protein [Stutzerimonas balearica]MBK3827482.1 hypothetical protein [Stutzerimonas balearica]MBK3857168.1 hypothetical protein [Stutzerimonas balearica]
MNDFVAAYESAKTQLEGISFKSTLINRTFKTTSGCAFLLEPEVAPQKAPAGKVAVPKKIKLDKRGRDFESPSPVYIRFISFKGENLANLTVSVVGSSGKPTAIVVTQHAGSAQCIVRDFCGGFHVNIKSGSARPVLSSVEIYGFLASDFASVKSLLNSYYDSAQALKDALDKAANEVSSSVGLLEENERRLVNVQSEIERAEETSAELAGQNKKLSEEINKLSLSRASLAEKVEALGRDQVAKENNCRQLSLQIDGLNQEVAEVSRELAGLVNDRSLISDEFRDYVCEGRRQSAVYIKLMVVPCVAVLLCAVLLYNGSHNILFGHYETSEDKLAALLLRMPFAAVLGGIAYYSWNIANRFLNKIFEVESERLTLAKLLVIAKDTVFSTAEQVGVDKSEKFYLRTRLKIEMLKAYLSKDLGASFGFELAEKTRTDGVISTSNEVESDAEDAADSRVA